MKDAVEITKNMLQNNYTIEVQALRSHSNTVSEATGESFSGIIKGVIPLCICIAVER